MIFDLISVIFLLGHDLERFLSCPISKCQTWFWEKISSLIVYLRMFYANYIVSHYLFVFAYLIKIGQDLSTQKFLQMFHSICCLCLGSLCSYCSSNRGKLGWYLWFQHLISRLLLCNDIFLIFSHIVKKWIHWNPLHIWENFLNFFMVGRG